MFTNFAHRLIGILGPRKPTGLQGAIDAKHSHDACLARNAKGGAAGSVPATLALTLGTPAGFGAFARASTADLLVELDRERRLVGGQRDADHRRPETTATGRLVNGTSAFPPALQVAASSAAGTSAGAAAGRRHRGPDRAADLRQPGLNDAVTVAFKQPIAASDALRTGRTRRR